MNSSKLESQILLLREYLSVLEKAKKTSLEEFKSVPKEHGHVERFLQLAIETTLNIGSHIISEMKWRKPTDYADIFRVLHNEGVITNKQLESNPDGSL